MDETQCRDIEHGRRALRITISFLSKRRSLGLRKSFQIHWVALPSALELAGQTGFPAQGWSWAGCRATCSRRGTNRK